MARLGAPSSSRHARLRARRASGIIAGVKMVEEAAAGDGPLRVAGAEPDVTLSARRPSAWAGARRFILQVALGVLAAEFAVLVRFSLPLPPDVLPFTCVIIAVCVVTVAAGFIGGATTMIVGGILTSYYLLKPSGTWGVDGRGVYFLFSYFTITGAILATSQMYRLAEQRRQAVALELALREAQHQQLFAREMAHRLKNAMAIVQAMATQTFSGDSPEVAKFNGRLLALADAHNLLNEHVKHPTASMAEWSKRRSLRSATAKTASASPARPWRCPTSRSSPSVSRSTNSVRMRSNTAPCAIPRVGSRSAGVRRTAC